MAVNARVTSRGLIQEKVDGAAENSRFIVEVPSIGLNVTSDTVTPGGMEYEVVAGTSRLAQLMTPEVQARLDRMKQWDPTDA